MVPKVLVDDCDPSITYTGSWSVQGQVDPTSKEFNGKVHKTTAPGSSLSYLFRGTRIFLYGTLAQPLTGTPAFRVTVDNSEPVAFNSSGDIRPTEADTPVWSHVPIFYMGHLPDEEHNISLVVDSASETHPFYFDFITVSTSHQRGTMVVDDDDDLIVYSGNWTRRTIDEEYLTSSHQPITVGSNATFRFNGTSIQVYGTIEDGVSQALEFTLDASKNTTLPSPLNSSLPRHSILYQARDLLSGQHQLTITYLNTSSSVYLDYWVYNASTGEATDSQEPDVAHSPDKGSTSNKRRIGAIIGGVVGGILFLLLLAAIILFLVYRRRQQTQPTHAVSEPFTTEPSSVDPLPTSPHVASISKGKGKARQSPSGMASTSSVVTPTQEGSTMLHQTEYLTHSSVSNDPPVDGSSPTDIPLIRINSGSNLRLVTLPDSTGIEARLASHSKQPPRSKEQTGPDYFSLRTRPGQPHPNDSLGPPTLGPPPTTFGPPTSPPPAYHDSG